MERIVQLQTSRNAETLQAWECFASHREHVTQILLAGASGSEGKLCILGAGNCNDLALNQLAEAFAQVDLVDIDPEAMNAGITRQGVATNRITARGPVDVTGVAHLLSAWTPKTPASDEQVDACISTAKRSSLPFNSSGYSVVASVCLISQLIESIALTLGTEHARFIELMTCVRRAHLRQLIDLTISGGMVVLITDIVSSLTVPELATAANSELPRLCERAIAQRNFFTGVNPFVIKRLLEKEFASARQLSDIRLTDPWVWDLGPRLYAVCALTAKRI